MDAPSMVQRSGDTLIIRSVVSGDQIYVGEGDTSPSDENVSISSLNLHNHIENSIEESDSVEEVDNGPDDTKDSLLPQCKIKRNYSCNNCSYFTQNPRHFLAHLRDIHGEKIIINECKHCLYASRHYQKLVRHMKMVHGSTEGLEEQAQSRKRASQLAREQKKRKLQAIEDSAPLSVLQMTPMSLVNKLPVPNLSPDLPNHKLLKCTVCEFTTLYRAQLVEHERDEHNKTKFFRCEKCSYVTHIKARFSKHVKYHSMPMIKCIMCDFRTPYKWNLDRHMKNHGGAGPFKCSACNFTADIKQSLTVHEMNHHVPPVGHASNMGIARRRNKVGGTDIVDNYSVVNLSENSDGGDGGDGDAMELDLLPMLSNNNNNNNNNDSYDCFNDNNDKIKLEVMNDSEYQTIPADLSQKTPLQCGSSGSSKKVARPVPGLIPIQQQPQQQPPVSPAVIAHNVLGLSSRNKQIFEAMVKQHSALKDLASLFGGDELFANATDQSTGTPQLSPLSNASSSTKRKNFFNELKERFADGGNLLCPCGHTSKCLSESIIHKKSCGKSGQKRASSSPVNLSTNSGSSRCQYCRQRCKSSADLFIHIQNCKEARNSAEVDSLDSESEAGSNDKIDISGDIIDNSTFNGPHPMENRVFVWNKIPQQATTDMPDLINAPVVPKMEPKHEGLAEQTDRSEDSENNEDDKVDDSTYYGVETAPGYGEVTKKMNPGDEAVNSSLKKVFKCPHCSFWASTASRFHVHIVGHLNKKPFECSLCSYRSNWRWDITKHIRLKTIRDLSHKNAKVLMNDETGRRNYTKYNKYITLMKVTEEDGDPKLLKSGEMTPSQEAALSFLQRNGDGASEVSDGVYNKTLPYLESLRNGGTEQVSATPPPDSEKNTDGESKKTSFKCKKCNFRHPNRDVVLAHVRGHYHEAGLLIEDKNQTSSLQLPLLNIPKPNELNNTVYMNNILSMCLSPNAGKLLQQQMQNGASPIPGMLSIPMVTPAIKNIPSSGTGTVATSSTNKHGETDEASSGGTSVVNGGWRGPAPYRCGFCHQVSNWKHVIQRHCRLKHDGDIRIELLEKGSNIYQPLQLQSGGHSTVAIEQDSLTKSTDTLTPQTNQMPGLLTVVRPSLIDSALDSTSNSIEAKNNAIVLGPDTLSTSVNNNVGTPLVQPKMLINLLTQNAMQPKATHKQQRYQCDVCPYNTDVKSQFIYHNSLHVHAGEIYQCIQCNYSVGKKHLLKHHMRIHTNIDGTLTSDSDSGESCSPTSDTSLARAVDLTKLPSTPTLSWTTTTIPIDLDDVISASKVPNKIFSTPNNNSQKITPANTISTLLQSTINKQLLKIQELRCGTDDCHDGEVQTIDKTAILTNDCDDTNSLPDDQSDNEEICPHCPYRANNIDLLKDHLKCHVCVSGHVNLVNCDHCDFSIADETQLKEHVEIHFGLIKSTKRNVAFYTSYDNLEINSTEYRHVHNNESTTTTVQSIKTLFPTKCGMESSSDKENKILVDVNTGQVL